MGMLVLLEGRRGPMDGGAVSEFPTTITLADGDVMTQDENRYFPSYVLDIDGICLRVERLTPNGSRWHAARSIRLSSGNYGSGIEDTRAECIAWVEARLAAMREALWNEAKP